MQKNNNDMDQNNSGNKKNSLHEGQRIDDLDNGTLRAATGLIDDRNIMLHSCWAFSVITQEIASANNVNNNELFGAMKDLNVLEQLATQGLHDVTLTVVQAFGNLATGADKMTSPIINETDILLIMKDYFDSKRFSILTRNYSNIVKETCWLSSITAGTQEQVMKIINLEIVSLLQQVFVEILQATSYLSRYGFVQNSQTYICNQSDCRIVLFPFTILFCFVWFFFFFYVILFWMQCVFQKTLKRFWHDDIDNLILFAEFNTNYAVFMHVDL